MNLVSTVMQFLTPMIANRIASSLGINNALVTTAIGAIVPAVLAGFAGKAATPAGATALSEALGKQDPGLLGSFAGMLGGASQNAVISSGSSALSALLGSQATGRLAGAIGTFTGLEKDASTNLIGMLAPVILGHLAQAKKSGGLDEAGLAKLLASQKDHIAAALPPGFAQLLGGTGLLDGIAGSPPDTTAAAAPAAPMANAPLSPPMPQAPPFNWIPWAAGAAALLVLYSIFGGSRPPSAPATVEKTATPAPGAATSTKEAVGQARTVVAGLLSTLGNVKDVATAQDALPKLDASSTALDALAKLFASLSPEVRAEITGIVAGALPQLQAAIANVLKIPGAEAIVKPVLEAILTKLATMSKP